MTGLPLERTEPQTPVVDEGAPPEPSAREVPSAQRGSGEPTDWRLRFRGFEAALPILAGALLLFALEAMSVTLAAWSLANPELLELHVVKNQVGRGPLRQLVASMVGVGLVACVIAGVWTWRRGIVGVTSLLRTAWCLSPLLIAGALPLLFNWKFWVDRHVVLMTLAAIVVVGFRHSLVAAMSAFGKGPPGGAAELVQAVAGVWRSLPEGFRRRLPTALAWAAALWYTAYFTHHTIETHFRLGTSAYDLGLEDNLLWNLIDGEGPAFKSSPIGPNVVHFSWHATLFSYVLLPFYALYQHAETLLFLQALIMGFGALPLYWFARPLIGAWPGALLAVLYVSNAAVQGSNLYDFHYTPLGPPFVFLTLYALQARRDLLAALAIALTLSIREDVSASVIITGIYFFAWGKRPKAGLIVACVGAVYFVAMKFFIMPLFGQSETHVHVYKGLIPAGEHGYGGVLKTVLGNPTFTLSTLLLEKKLIYALQILVPFAFLPFKRLVGWFFCLPGFFFTLLASGWDPPHSLGFQYSAHWMFLFPGVAVILAAEQRPQHDSDTLGSIRRRAWLAAIALGTLIVTYQYGIVFQRNFAKAAFDTVSSGFSPAQREKLRLLRELIAKLPPRAKIAGSERLVPHFSNRPDAYRLSHGIFDAEYLLVDRTNLSREEMRLVTNALRAGTFGVTEINGDFVIARRGAPVERNAEWRKTPPASADRPGKR